MTMDEKNKLELDRYLFVKKHAYRTAAFLNTLTIKDFSNFIKLGIPYEPGTPEYTIFMTTLVLPNDVAALNSYDKEHRLTDITKGFNVPTSIAIAKIFEYKLYDLRSIFATNEEFLSLAGQNINLLKVLDPLDESILTFFPNQPYIAEKEKENEKIKQHILTAATN